MLEILSGIVTLVLLGLSAVIGVRLVRRTRGPAGGPERLLGLYFVVYGAVATGLSVGTYLGWSSAEHALPPAAARVLNGAFYVTATIGLSCLLLFTQRTFRPGSRLAKAVVRVDAAVLAGAALGVALTEGFEVRVLNGPFYWLHFAARLVPWIWVSGESFAFWARQRRRLAVGLADPVVTNRFLLWGVWGTVTTLLAFADPLARLWYVSITGTADAWIPEVGRPIIDVVVPLTCGLNVANATLMVLTFFPTPAYRRWISARQPARA